MHDPTVPSPEADDPQIRGPGDLHPPDSPANSAEIPTADLVAPNADAAGDRLSSAAESPQDTMLVADVVLRPTPPIPPQFQNLAANGGAIGALALGVLTVGGAFLTDWSIINGLLGIAMAGWGWRSKLKRTTLVGFALCVFGLALCALL